MIDLLKLFFNFLIYDPGIFPTYGEAGIIGEAADGPAGIAVRVEEGVVVTEVVVNDFREIIGENNVKKRPQDRSLGYACFNFAGLNRNPSTYTQSSAS